MLGREGDTPTVPAPSSGPGAVLVVSDDADLVQRIRHALREPAWQLIVAGSLPGSEGFFAGNVVVLDPQGDRLAATVAVEQLAHVVLRPSVVLVLRVTEDLATAVTFGVGCVEANAVSNVLADVVDRAYRFRRHPRLLGER
jgi:hypothetical protein